MTRSQYVAACIAGEASAVLPPNVTEEQLLREYLADLREELATHPFEPYRRTVREEIARVTAPGVKLVFHYGMPYVKGMEPS
jgi:hypothetical protein